MKKVFLLGTMLGVAATALAFGGVFSHGSKSSTYKGGVDAIGVHFGGEKKTADSQPEEETCPAEKQCGDYCCQGDNVCNTESGEPQCCNEYKCCAANEAAYCLVPNCAGGPPPQCCTGTMYCPSRNANGSCGSYACCPAGQQVSCVEKDSNGACRQSACCGSDETAYCSKKYDGICQTAACAADGCVVSCAAEREDGVCTTYGCCPSNQIPYCKQKARSGTATDSTSVLCYGLSPKCCDTQVIRGEGIEPDVCVGRENEGF